MADKYSQYKQSGVVVYKQSGPVYVGPVESKDRGGLRVKHVLLIASAVILVAIVLSLTGVI